MNKIKGFTLVEAMIVVALMGVLAALAYPSFQYSMDNARVKKAAGAIENALDRARISAIETNKRVTLCAAVAAQDQCAGGGANWNNGILVFSDDNADGLYTSGEKLIEIFPLVQDVNVQPNGNMTYVSFLGGGSKAAFSGGIPATLVVTPSRAGSSKKICLKLNRLGRTVRDENCS